MLIVRLRIKNNYYNCEYCLRFINDFSIVLNETRFLYYNKNFYFSNYFYMTNVFIQENDTKKRN